MAETCYYVFPPYAIIMCLWVILYGIGKRDTENVNMGTWIMEDIAYLCTRNNQPFTQSIGKYYVR